MKYNNAWGEMPDIAKYLDDDVEFRNDLGKWAERNYRVVRHALAMMQKLQEPSEELIMTVGFLARNDVKQGKIVQYMLEQSEKEIDE